MQYRDAIERYGRALKDQGRSAKTRKNHAQCLYFFGRWLEERGVDWQHVTEDIFAEHMVEFARSHTAGTTRNHRAALTRFYRWAVQCGWIEQSPMPQVPSVRPTVMAVATRSQPSPIDSDFAQAIIRFYRRLLRRNCSERTARNYEYLLVRFGRWLRREQLRFTDALRRTWSDFSNSTSASDCGPTARSDAHIQAEAQQLSH